MLTWFAHKKKSPLRPARVLIELTQIDHQQSERSPSQACQDTKLNRCVLMATHQAKEEQGILREQRVHRFMKMMF